MSGATPPDDPRRSFEPVGAARFPELHEAPIERRSRRRLTGVIVATIAALGVMAVGIVIAWQPAPPPGAAAQSPVTTEQPATSAPPVSAPTTGATEAQAKNEPVVKIGGLRRDEAAPPERASDPAGLLRVLRECVADVGDSATERAWRFEQATRSVADAWAGFERTTVEEANRLVAQYVIGSASDAAAFEDALQVITSGSTALSATGRIAAHEVWAASWSAGVLSHLASIEDSPQRVRTRAGAALAALSLDGASGGFWNGARAALLAMPRRIAGVDEATGDTGTSGTWRRWTQGVEAAWRDDAPGRDRALLRGVGDLLAAASKRSQDQTTRSILLQMLTQVDWSENGHARDALLLWLEDAERVSSRELATVTQWMVSGAPDAAIGVDHVLSAAAADQDRARLRDALAARWGLNSPAMAESARSQWVAAARSALAVGVNGGADAFERTARLARLCESAALIRRGEAAQARLSLSAAALGASSDSGGGGALGADAAGRDGRWAVQFLAARRNAAERRAALAKLGVESATLGVIDAEVVVEAALVGSPVDVRNAAARIVERHASEATVVNALLEQLPSAPRTALAARLYERAARSTLPPVRDKDWPIAARRALVARLLETLDAGDGLASLDEWAGAIAEAYEGWSPTLSARAAAPAPSAEDEDEALEGGGMESAAPASARRVAADPAEAAAAVFDDLRSEIAATGDAGAVQRLRALERRQSARRMLARGPMQRFVAEQTGVLEAMALLAATEEPGLAAPGAAVVDRAEDERRRAEIVDAQIEATQRAMLELWLLMLDQGGRS